MFISRPLPCLPMCRLPRQLVLISLLCVPGTVLRAQVTLEADSFSIRLGANARVEQVLAKPGEEPIAFDAKGNAFLRISQHGKALSPSELKLDNGLLVATFGPAGPEVVFSVGRIGPALHLQVERVTGEGIAHLTIAELRLAQDAGDAGWGVSVAALNEFTSGVRHPGMHLHGHAMAYSRLGLERGAAAVLVAKREAMREGLKQVVEAAPAIPKSSVGGPFAMDTPMAYGSYLFAGQNVTEDNVDEVIEVADRLGLNQLNMHPVRYGDWKPHEKYYPQGRESLKRVVDKIHAAGMLAGVHTYSQFLSKSCPYVTPVPDRRLGVDAVFTLAEALDAKATTVTVEETTEEMSAVTGFFIRNSATVRIGDELIVYKGVAKNPPFAFTECTRGAYGTRAAPHEPGAKVHHLRECFGLFVPDGDSTLYSEVARNLADLINECGFDMLYLDALDGSDAVAGRPWAWHYAAKFTFEIFRHLRRPVLAEMSTFPHHQWYVRSRSGAWDHPTRSHKVFIDIHAEANRDLATIFLPSHLGWWMYKTFQTFSQEPTYFDDIEHLGVRCLGANAGVSIQGVSPTTLRTVPALARLAAITRRYESLRRANYFDEATRARLRETGAEFSLHQAPTGQWQLRPSLYKRHKVTALDNGSQCWTMANEHGEQAPFIRIQALHSVGPYNATDDRVLAQFADPEEFGDHQAVKNVTATLAPTADPVKAGMTSMLLTATNTGKPGAACWARWSKVFDPPIDLTGRQAMGVWVHGDGKGQVLNLQLRSPIHMTYAYGEHYVTVDFTGWKYFELVEPDAEDYRNCQWPYRSWYAVYRTTTRYNAIRELNLYVNNVPAGETVTCALSPVRGLPLIESPIANPRITIGGRTLTFPVTIPTGSYLEFDGRDAHLFGRKGELLEVVTPTGEALALATGENTLEFVCDAPAEAVRPRAMVTVGLYGEALLNTQDKGAVTWAELAREIDEPRQILALDGEQNRWITISRDAAKRATLDFELVVNRLDTAAAPHESEHALVIDSFDDPGTFADSAQNDYLRYVVSGARTGFPASEGVTHELAVERRSKKLGKASVRYTATSTRAGGWSARGRRFAEPLDLTAYSHIGFWIKGDGLGETLYFQLRDRQGVHFDMKTEITFTGWRFASFARQKPEFDFGAVEYLILYYNGLPANQTVNCQVDAMHAYNAGATLRNPALKVGRRKLTFPVVLRANDVLAYCGQEGTCELRRGTQRIPVNVRGRSPTLSTGVNKLELTADIEPGADLALTAQVMKRYSTGK